MSDSKQKPETAITYVLEDPGTHPIKIGQAKYYQDHISQLRNGSPIEPKPVCAFLGAKHEHEMHKRFAHLRVRGEFFHYTQEVRDFLEAASGKLSHDEAIRISPRVVRNRDKMGEKELELMPSLETNE